jgi:hypothetical protein
LRAHCLDDTVERVLGNIEAELSGLDLSNVEHGVDEA